jgi:hypothetical protein
MSTEAERLCGLLQDFQVLRKHWIASEVALMNRTTALIARVIGYDAHAEEASREKIWKQASALLNKFLAGKPVGDNRVLALLAPELEVTRQALEPITTRRAEVEAEMERLALLTPGAEFVAQTRGFGALGLAVIIGEAGNLCKYPNVAKLWRRLGYGMAHGHEQHAYSTWRRQGGLNAAAWTEAGYNPRRLAQIFGVVTDPLARHKKNNNYGAVYLARRERTLQTHPEWYRDKNGNPKLNEDGTSRSAHAHMDALRVMTKALLRDLWIAWHLAAINRLVPKIDLPPDTLSPQGEPAAAGSVMPKSNVPRATSRPDHLGEAS